MESEAKPKRVLTEAQRLAFLKGREKRLANLERKRQEKLEMDLPDEPSEEIPEDPVPEIKPEVLTKPEPVDYDVLADRVAKIVVKQMEKKKKPDPVERSADPVPAAAPKPQPPVQEFLWC